MTIDEVKALQASRGLRDVHVVELTESGFTIAHTDVERDLQPDVPLDACQLHQWLVDYGPPNETPGIYVVGRVADGWSFTLLPTGQVPRPGGLIIDDFDARESTCSHGKTWPALDDSGEVQRFERVGGQACEECVLATQAIQSERRP